MQHKGKKKNSTLTIKMIRKGKGMLKATVNEG